MPIVDRFPAKEPGQLARNPPGSQVNASSSEQAVR